MIQHIKKSFSYMRRSPFQALAAISVLAMAFFVTTLLIVVMYSSEQILRYFETRPQVIAFIKDEAGDTEIEALKSKLENDSRVKSVAFVTKEEALGIYEKSTADNPLLKELVSPSIFPASIEFSVVDLNFVQDVIGEVAKEEIVQSVDFTANIGGSGELGNAIERLKKITFYVRVAGLVVVSAMLLTSFLVLAVVIGMRMIVRRPEVENLSLIGATGWFIRAPIVFEAINYAVIGVFTGWLMASVMIMYATPYVLTYFGEIQVFPKESAMFFAFLGIILGMELVVGIIISLLGSVVAVSRSLRMVK